MAEVEDELRSQLDNATSYEERSRLRAQLRALKKGGSSAPGMHKTTNVEKTGSRASRNAAERSKPERTTSDTSKSVAHRSPSPPVTSPPAEQRSTATIMLSANKLSPPPAVQELIRERRSSESSRASSSRSSPAPVQVSTKRDVSRSGVNGEREHSENDRVSEDDDIAQIEDMIRNSSDFRQRRQYRKQLDDLRAAREAKLTQRRAETASNNKANEVANKDVPEQQESQTIKRSSPEAESLPNKDESVGQIENRNDESDEGVGEEQLSEDEQIEHLKELIESTADFRKRRQYKNELRDLERRREEKLLRNQEKRTDMKPVEPEVIEIKRVETVETVPSPKLAVDLKNEEVTIDGGKEVIELVEVVDNDDFSEDERIAELEDAMAQTRDLRKKRKYKAELEELRNSRAEKQKAREEKKIQLPTSNGSSSKTEKADNGIEEPGDQKDERDGKVEEVKEAEEDEGNKEVEEDANEEGGSDEEEEEGGNDEEAVEEEQEEEETIKPTTVAKETPSAKDLPTRTESPSVATEASRITPVRKLPGAVETPLKISAVIAKETGIKGGDFRSVLKGSRGSAQQTGKEGVGRSDAAQVDFRGVLRKSGGGPVVLPKPVAQVSDAKPDYRAVLKKSVQTATKKYPSGGPTGGDFRGHLRKQTQEDKTQMVPLNRSQSPRVPFGKHLLHKTSPAHPQQGHTQEKPDVSSSEQKERHQTPAEDEPSIRRAVSQERSVSRSESECSDGKGLQKKETGALIKETVSSVVAENEPIMDREEGPGESTTMQDTPTTEDTLKEESPVHDDSGDVNSEEKQAQPQKAVPPPVKQRSIKQPVRDMSPSIEDPVTENKATALQCVPSDSEDSIPAPDVVPVEEPVGKKKTKKVVVKKVVKKKVVKKVKSQASQDAGNEESTVTAVEAPVVEAVEASDKLSKQKDKLFTDGGKYEGKKETPSKAEETPDSYEERAKARRERRMKKERGEAVEESARTRTRDYSDDYSARGAARRQARLEEKRKPDQEAKQRREKFKESLDGKSSPDSKSDGQIKKSANSGQQQLLQWVKSRTKFYENIEITDFSKSFSNGLAFCALAHSYFPDKIPYDDLTSTDKKRNFDLAFTTFTEGGMSEMLDANDFTSMTQPDPRSVMTYLSSIYHHFK